MQLPTTIPLAYECNDPLLLRLYSVIPSLVRGDSASGLFFLMINGHAITIEGHAITTT